MLRNEFARPGKRAPADKFLAPAFGEAAAVALVALIGRAARGTDMVPNDAAERDGGAEAVLRLQTEAEIDVLAAVEEFLVEAAEDRERLWSQVSAAAFLSDAEKRAMLGLALEVEENKS